MSPYIILAAIISIGLAGGFGYAKGHRDGATSEKAAWYARQITQGALYSAKLLEAENAARAAEDAKADAVRALDTAYQKRLTDAQILHDADVAAARAGAIVLHDPGAPACPAGDRSAGPVAAPASVSDGPARPGLSAAANEFLLSLADEADQLVNQLTACQAVITADRSAP